MEISKLALGLGVTASGLGIAAATGVFSRTSINPNEDNFDFELEPETTEKKIRKSKNIKENYKTVPCVGSLFNNLDWEYKSENEEENNITKLSNTNTSGCLAVWWEKETYGNKWKGFWNLTWAMKNDKKGIIFTTRVITDNGRLLHDSAFYFLKQVNNEWKVFLKTEQETDTEINEHTKDLVAQAREDLTDRDKAWKFNLDNTNICTEEDSECADATTQKETEKVEWDFVPETNANGKTVYIAHEWSKNLDKWKTSAGTFSEQIEEYFSDIKGYYSLKVSTCHN